MPSVSSLLLVIVVFVCSVVPYVVNDGDYSQTGKQFGSLPMQVQLVTYSIARLCSFIGMPSMQIALLERHGGPAAAIVVTLGEAAGLSAICWLV